MREIVSLTEWANTPAEYKLGDMRGHINPRVLRYNDTTGATELVPVEVVSDWVASQQRAMARMAAIAEVADAEGWECGPMFEGCPVCDGDHEVEDCDKFDCGE